jgi:hypothetical protein
MVFAANDSAPLGSKASGKASSKASNELPGGEGGCLQQTTAHHESATATFSTLPLKRALTYIYIYIYIYIHTYIHTYIHIHMYMYIRT